MWFVPDAATMLAYSLACLVLFITPGPDMSLFLARTFSGGRAAGIASMTGASVGCIVHSVLAAAGVSALIAASPAAFTVLKIVGTLYLLWLAVDAIRHGSSLNIREGEKSAQPLRRVFGLGLMVNLSNPKIVLFFLTFLPQFVNPSHPHAAGQLLFLGVYFTLFSYPLGVLMILAAERFVMALKQRPSVMRAIDWLFAGVFGAFAAKVLTTESR
jgi:threonine/homoserine/homoserine lactone efflux protein